MTSDDHFLHLSEFLFLLSTEPLDLNDPNLVKAIWKPEVYFPNAKDAEFQYVTVPNVLVRIDPGGQILYMLRYSLTFTYRNCTIDSLS